MIDEGAPLRPDARASATRVAERPLAKVGRPRNSAGFQSDASPARRSGIDPPSPNDCEDGGCSQATTQTAEITALSGHALAIDGRRGIGRGV